MSRVSLSREVSVWGISVQGLCPVGRGLCPEDWVSVQGGLCPGGLCSGRCLPGVSVQEGLCPEGGVPCPVGRGLCPEDWASVQGRGSLSGGLCPGRPAPPYGNVQAERILLECILVY